MEKTNVRQQMREKRIRRKIDRSIPNLKTVYKKFIEQGDGSLKQMIIPMTEESKWYVVDAFDLPEDDKLFLKIFESIGKGLAIMGEPIYGFSYMIDANFLSENVTYNSPKEIDKGLKSKDSLSVIFFIQSVDGDCKCHVERISLSKDGKITYRRNDDIKKLNSLGWLGKNQNNNPWFHAIDIIRRSYLLNNIVNIYDKSK